MWIFFSFRISHVILVRDKTNETVFPSCIKKQKPYLLTPVIVVARAKNANSKDQFQNPLRALSLSIMSGKNQSNASSSSSNTNSSGNSNTQSEPTVIQGWEHSTYANANSTYANDRYAYIGKDDDTREPMWMDNGPKGKK